MKYSNPNKLAVGEKNVVILCFRLKKYFSLNVVFRFLKPNFNFAVKLIFFKVAKFWRFLNFEVQYLQSRLSDFNDSKLKTKFKKNFRISKMLLWPKNRQTGNTAKTCPQIKKDCRIQNPQTEIREVRYFSRGVHFLLTSVIYKRVLIKTALDTARSNIRSTPVWKCLPETQTPTLN